MSIQTITKEINVNILSGVSMPLPFLNWWKEKTNNLNIKEPTVGFMDSFFVFLQSNNCVIVNKEEVTYFLNNHTSIIDYLYDAPNIIFQYFGDVKLNLELFFDPEVEGDEGELFLNIETDFDAQKAHEKLKEIDKEWLLKINKKDINLLNLNIEFT